VEAETERAIPWRSLSDVSARSVNLLEHRGEQASYVSDVCACAVAMPQIMVNNTMSKRRTSLSGLIQTQAVDKHCRVSHSG
jgi:hypothetical protein